MIECYVCASVVDEYVYEMIDSETTSRLVPVCVHCLAELSSASVQES